VCSALWLPLVLAPPWVPLLAVVLPLALELA
jgi:hypothetical protein